MKYPPGNTLFGVDTIIVHHSATEDSGTLSWSAIERYHTVAKGWQDIGYHAGIEYVRDGYIVILGRPEYRSGAHTSGYNMRSLGFLFVGNYDEQRPSQEMLEVAARRWFIPVMRRYDLKTQDIYPHRDFSQKSCPGNLFDMARLQSAIARYAEDL